MSAMSFALGREKALPDIPVDIDAGSSALVADEELWLVPSSDVPTSANTNKALPSIKVEHTLSEEEMRRLHELWNGAGLSARAHRRRRRGQYPTPRRIPAPIFIPDPEDIDIPIFLSSADPSTTNTTPSTTVPRKRWGFLSARPFSEPQEGESKVPNALKKLRVMAQDRLKKKLRYAKSAPNLGDQAAPLEREVAHRPPVPMTAKAPLRDVKVRSSRTPSSPSKSANPEPNFQPEDVDEHALYFTIDPNWRVSWESVQFQFITPIPDSPTSLGRPDSPLLHRHHSLDQLEFAAQEAAKALTTMEFPDMYPDEGLHPIDELHSYLDL